MCNFGLYGLQAIKFFGNQIVNLSINSPLKHFCVLCEMDSNLLINIFIAHINYENWIWLSMGIVICNATPSIDSRLYRPEPMKRHTPEHKHRFNWSHPSDSLIQSTDATQLVGQKLNYYPSTALSFLSVPFVGGRRVRGHLYRLQPLHQHIFRIRSRCCRPWMRRYCFVAIFFCGSMVRNVLPLLFSTIRFLDLTCFVTVSRVDSAIEINRFTPTINKMNDSINSDQFILRLCMVFRDLIILIEVTSFLFVLRWNLFT